MAEIKTPEGVIIIEDAKSIEIFNKILEAKTKAEADITPVREKLNETTAESVKRKEQIREKDALISQLETQKNEFQGKVSEMEKLTSELKTLKDKDNGALTELIKSKEADLEKVKGEALLLKTENELTKKEIDSLKEFQNKIREKETAKRNALMEEVKQIAEARPDVLKVAEAIQDNDALETFLSEISRRPGNYDPTRIRREQRGDAKPDPNDPHYLSKMDAWEKAHK
jgi:chromosome segregation ATPase